MEKNKLNILIVGLVLASIFSIVLVSAEPGCCLDISTGFCSMNAEESACTTGNFFDNPSCSNNECNLGCCIISGNGQMTTSRTCELNSRTANVVKDFRNDLNRSECAGISASKVKGACITGEYNDLCTYTTQEDCGSDNFKAGIFCCDVSLNTSCKKTTKTICQDDGAYYLDSCNQICEKKENCDYNSGFICEKKGIEQAHCRSLNCDSIGKKNGESWCISPEEALAGSRYFKQICVDGEVETEPCADFRLETCANVSAGDEVTCKINPWQDCLAAGNDSEECNPEYCKMWPTAAPESENPEGETETNVNIQIWGNGGNIVILTNGVSSGGHDSGYYQASGFIPITLTGTNEGSLEKYFQDLRLATCLPLVQGGINFYSSKNSGKSSTESAKSVCSAGDYSATLYFDHDKGDCGKWRLKSWDNPDEYINGEDVWGNAGIITMYEGLLPLDSCEGNGLQLLAPSINSIFAEAGDGDAAAIAKKLNSLASSGELPNPAVIRILQERCRLISDCGQKSSIFGNGGGSGVGTFTCRSGGGEGDHVTCNFQFKCKPFKAGEGDCSQCGSDGLPCSEYRCKAAGGNCDFYEKGGVDGSGSCVSSTDTAPPKITLKSITPNPPIRPYTPAEFIITTDKNSECKFSLDSAGSKFDGMKYDFGDGFDTEHKIILNIPGQTDNNVLDLEEGTLAFNLMKEGNHTIYVRCLDAAGHGQSMAPFAINFEVMQNPDKLAPVVMNASPVSGSAIKYNTTQKNIIFYLNEPAECKWELNDTEYSEMSHNLTCQTLPSVNAALENNGYYTCSGTLGNVTLNLSSQTKFYLRCKDQAWLEGKESDLYSRNTNQESYVYSLRPSSIFNISQYSPSGDVIKKAANKTVEIKVTTSGGGSNGKSKCYWKLSNFSDFGDTTFTEFYTTNSNLHKQIISDKPTDTYYVGIKCIDASENQAELNFSYNLLVDESVPLITKIYQYSSSLRVKTNEAAKCYVSSNISNGCSFLTANSTRMEGSELDHKINWEGKTYFIRCEDYFGNANTDQCNMIARTYEA